MKRKHLERFAEFFLIGLVMGIAEDLIAVTLSTGATISWRMIGIITFVALPFAAFSELIVDRKDFFSFFKSKVKEEATKIKNLSGKIRKRHKK